jgi:hypothetical protein
MDVDALDLRPGEVMTNMGVLSTRSPGQVRCQTLELGSTAMATCSAQGVRRKLITYLKERRIVQHGHRHNTSPNFIVCSATGCHKRS